MSHFAALIARTQGRWKGVDPDNVALDNLGDLDDIEDLADMLRDASIADGPVVVFIEEDDEWFTIVRVDGGGEPRVFASDVRVVGVSDLAMTLFGDLASANVAGERSLDDFDDADEADDEGSDDSVRPIAEPAGAFDVLADFGISASDLLAMCAEEGALPADIITAICERLGCADEIEVYR